MPPTTPTELLHWESQYIAGTRAAHQWLRDIEIGFGYTSGTYHTDLSKWIKDAAQAAVNSGKRLPKWEHDLWKEAVEARGRTIEYWRARVEPWDIGRKKWVRRHEGYADAMRDAYNLVDFHCYRVAEE